MRVLHNLSYFCIDQANQHMEIGYKIKKIREIRNYSQEYMAERLGISQVAYSRLETGKTKFDLNRMQDIASILEIDPVFLLTFDESVVFNHCQQSGKIVNNYNGIESQNLIESRLSKIEDLVSKIQLNLDFLNNSQR